MDDSGEPVGPTDAASEIREQEEFRFPVAGERVETEDGEGVVEDVARWEDVRWGLDGGEAKRLLARLGSMLTERYAEVTVELDDGDVEEYHIWEIDYDSERDPPAPPWRG